MSTEGGSPNEWARLINAYGVLGDFKNAQSAWEEAKNIFKGDAISLEKLSAAAVNIGLK